MGKTYKNSKKFPTNDDFHCHHLEDALLHNTGGVITDAVAEVTGSLGVGRNLGNKINYYSVFNNCFSGTVSPDLKFLVSTVGQAIKGTLA